MRYPRLLNRMRKHLKKPLEIIKKSGGDLKKHGQGTQVVSYYGHKYVYKLSPKQIGYFKTFKGKSVHDFKSDVYKMRLHFLKINKILYSTKKLFVYKQRICDMIKKTKYNKKYLTMSMLLMIIAMIQHNLIVTDIGKHNIGVFEDNILTFDLQGIKPFKKADKGRLKKHIKKYTGKNVSISKNTHKFKKLYRDYYKKHKGSLTKKQDKILETKYKHLH